MDEASEQNRLVFKYRASKEGVWTSWRRSTRESKGDGWWHTPEWGVGDSKTQHSVWVDGALVLGESGEVREPAGLAAAAAAQAAASRGAPPPPPAHLDELRRATQPKSEKEEKTPMQVGPYPDRGGSLPLPGQEKKQHKLNVALRDSVSCYVASRDGSFKKKPQELTSAVVELERIKERLCGTRWDCDGHLYGELQLLSGGALKTFTGGGRWSVELDTGSDGSMFKKGCSVRVSSEARPPPLRLFP